MPAPPWTSPRNLWARRPDRPLFPGPYGSDSQTRTGWVGGIGIEYSVWKNVFFKIEYLHADFGTSRYIDPSVTLLRVVPRDVSLTDEIVRIGINYKLY